MKNSTFLQRYKELLLGLAMLALAAFYIYHATLIRVRSTVSVNAKLIPEILGVLVIILAAFQIGVGILHLMASRREIAANKAQPVLMNEEERGNIPPILLTFLLLIGYAVSFEFLGFVIASTICMFLQMLLLAPREKRNVKLFALISAVTAVVVYLAFRQGLNLSLPRGLLEFIPL